MLAPTSARPSFASSTRAVVCVLRPRATPVPRFARRRTRRHASPHPVPACRARADPAVDPAPDLLVEVSTGGAQQRRWARSPTGGFERLPPVREPSASLPGASSSSSSSSATSSWDPRQSPRLRAIFLPAGYPDTVSPDYAPFIRWHLGSLVFRNILEVLTAQSLLVALGMGSTPGALPLTAATKWVLKDGVGSFATLFAGSLGGQRYDEDPKRWWAFTNLLEDVARVLELVTPAAPALFLPLAASATFVRSAALTGRGSLMNGTFMQHLGRNQNLGDVRAKLEVQGRWLALVALPAGIGIFRAVAGSFDDAELTGAARYSAAVAAYGSVVAGHAVCCWKAASVLRFDTLNRARLLNAARHFLREGAEGVPTTEAAGAAEGVYRARTPPGTPTLGASLPDAARDWTHLETLLALGRAEAAHDPGVDAEVDAGVDAGVGSNPNPKRNSPRSMAAPRRRFVLGWDARRDAPAALLDASATPDDVIAAALAAVHAADAADARRTSRNGGGGGTVGVTFANVANGLGVTSGGEMDAATAEAAYAYADRRAGEFSEAMRAAGWRTDFVQMGTAPKYRLDALGNAGGEGLAET